MRPPFGARANVVMVRSISPVSRTLNALNSTLKDGARASIAPNCPLLEATIGFCRTATRLTPGAICLSRSNHLPPIPYSNGMNPVALPPGRAMLCDKPGADRIDNIHEDDRHGASRLQQRGGHSGRGGENDIRGECDQLSRISAIAVGIGDAPAVLDLHVAAGPAQVLHPFPKRREAGLRLRCILSVVHEHPDAPHPLWLPRVHRDWPRRRRAAEQRDELAASSSLDHLVGCQEQAGRHSQAKRLRRLEIDGRFIPGWGLHRQVGRLVTA